MAVHTPETVSAWAASARRRQSLGSERATVEALRTEVVKAQRAVRSEQDLAERLRREATAASANAQRQVCPAIMLSLAASDLNCMAIVAPCIV